MLKEGVETLVSDAVMIALHCENICIAQTEKMACSHHKQFGFRVLVNPLLHSRA